MIRATLLILSALVSIGLAYAGGLWVLFALFAAALTTVLFSSEKAPASDDADRDAAIDFGQAGRQPGRHGARTAKL